MLQSLHQLNLLYFSFRVAFLVCDCGPSVTLLSPFVRVCIRIALVASGANGDGAAVSGERDAASGAIASGFSIDVSAELLPIAV